MSDSLSKIKGTEMVKTMPKITCVACNSSNVRGYYDPKRMVWCISCSDCGTSMERPDVSDMTELENEVDILNSYEKLRYNVNKSKEEANGIHEN